MDQQTWRVVDGQLDNLAKELGRLLLSSEAESLREMLANLARSVADRHNINLTCVIDAFDEQVEHSLPLLTIGLGTRANGDVYPTAGDSTPGRYVVDGEIEVVPHDRCPQCLDVWDFKLDHPTCPHCDATLGVNCWVLLDSDVCPNCEKGKVSATKPHCTKCSFKFDPRLVKWG